MTVESDISRAQYETSGITGPYTVPFYFLADDEISVTYTDATGADTLLVLDVDYSVMGAGSSDGGTVITANAYAAGGKLVIVRDVDFVQETEYPEASPFPAKSHERALDRLTMMAQQLREELNRALAFPASEEGSGVLPDAATRGGKMIGFDSDGNLVVVIPASGSAADLALQLAGALGAPSIGYLAAGAGAVLQTVARKLGTLRGPTDFGALGVQTSDATAPGQLAIDASLDDAYPGNSFFIGDGTFPTQGWTVDVGKVTTSTAGRFSAHGLGTASMLLMNANPNTNVFNVEGNAGQSYALELRNFRVQVTPQGDNVNSYVMDTGLANTCLDSMYSGLYVNGIARGIGGQLVSFNMTGLFFDFMTDYAIHGKSKEFRKGEIVGCHMYKVAQNAIRIEGDTDSSGNPTNLSDRDNGRGAGHITITGVGFDRDIPGQTCQNIYATSVDNMTHAGNWFNGKSPDQLTYPLDAIRYVDLRYGSFAAQQIWYYGRGVYLQDCTGLDVGGLNIVKGNQNAVASSGALTCVNVTDSVIRANVIASGGMGASFDGCVDCTIELRVTDAWFTGVKLTNCSRIKLRVVVVDANKADSATATNTYGVQIGVGCSGIELEVPHSYVTDTSQGQKVNLFIDPSLSAGAVRIRGGGRFINVRTTGQAVSDASAVMSVNGKVDGYTVENTVQATFASGATTVTVAHGLDRTPLLSEFMPYAGGLLRGCTMPRATAVDATNVTMTAETGPSGGSATWNLYVRTAR